MDDHQQTLYKIDQGRLGLTFHRTFSLIRPALTQILEIVNKHGGLVDETGKIQKDIVRDVTNLGTIYAAAMPRYCFGAGSLNSQYLFTDFGRTAFENDRLLDTDRTQWLIHYHLSAPNGPGPLFWHELVVSRFRRGDKFRLSDLAEQISKIYERTEGKKLQERSARSTASIFLGTYTKDDGLGKLNSIKNRKTMVGLRLMRILKSRPLGRLPTGY